MERDLRLDWPALVKEARRRRKALSLTQIRLAAIAGVSTPTVSHFEAGDKNIQLASALAILEALGLVVPAGLAFPERVERFDPDRDAVLFSGRAESGTVDCAITGDALAASYGAKGRSARALLAAFRGHRAEIEDQARRKLTANALEKDGSVLLRPADIGPAG